MNMDEYEKVKNMTYLQYCDYLQSKYGIGLADYMSKNFHANPKCKRTKEGLIAHHKAEDKMIMLSTKEVAEKCPFEWQLKEQIVYCDYLEHLFLHVLICKYPSPKKVTVFQVGIGGVAAYLVPELNDIYSGWITKQEWRKNCHKKIINDEDVYLKILGQFVDWYKKEYGINQDILRSSMNDKYGLWKISQNEKLFKKIDKLWKKRWFFLGKIIY